MPVRLPHFEGHIKLGHSPEQDSRSFYCQPEQRRIYYAFYDKRFRGSDVRLSHPPTRGDAYQTLAEPMVLELVPVGGDNEE